MRTGAARNTFQLISVSLLSLFSFLCVAQGRSPSGDLRPRQSRPALPRRAPTNQEVVAPFWTLEPGWDTQLELRNNLAHGDLEVTPVLRKPDATELQGSPVRIATEEVQSPPSTPVRTNTLEFTNTVLKFTNQGPTK
jgi:hypothetical protein